ncbi:MAG: hypothetical protein RLT05_05190 [Bauldia litoralis]
MNFGDIQIRPAPGTTAGGAPEPAPRDTGGRYRPPAWKRNLAWGAYGVAMLAVLGIALYALL